MSLSRFKLFNAVSMATDQTSDVVWVDGDDFSIQFISASDTRAGNVYIDMTDDGPEDASQDWTTIAASSFAVGAGVALNRMESVAAKSCAGVRVRWERTAGTGTLKATCCVQRLAEE